MDFFKVRTTSPYLLYAHLRRVHILASSPLLRKIITPSVTRIIATLEKLGKFSSVLIG